MILRSEFAPAAPFAFEPVALQGVAGFFMAPPRWRIKNSAEGGVDQGGAWQASGLVSTLQRRATLLTHLFCRCWALICLPWGGALVTVQLVLPWTQGRKGMTSSRIGPFPSRFVLREISCGGRGALIPILLAPVDGRCPALASSVVVGSAWAKYTWLRVRPL